MPMPMAMMAAFFSQDEDEALRWLRSLAVQ